MLKITKAFSSFSVPDLKVAKQFYAETLGQKVKESPVGLELQLEGGGHVFIYDSPTNAPADFTILNLAVADIDQAVEQLVGKGIQMERYDMPDAQIKTDEKGIARFGTDVASGPQAMAWFKDPAGNIIALMQEA